MVRIQYADRWDGPESTDRPGWPCPVQAVERDDADLRGRAPSPHAHAQSDATRWDLLRVQARTFDPGPHQRAVFALDPDLVGIIRRNPSEEAVDRAGPRDPGWPARRVRAIDP